MYNKINSISLAFVSLLFSVAVFPVNASTEIDQAKSNITSLIKEGNYAQAEIQTQALLDNIAPSPDLSEAIYEIAERYRWSNKSDKYACAAKLYKQIIQDYPGSPCAEKAALGVSKTKVLSSIVARDYKGADKALDELVTDFSDHPLVSDVLYWIARGYGYWERFDKEKEIYLRIIQNYPDCQYIDKARLGFARANVQSLIILQDFDSAKEALDRMVTDFSLNGRNL